MTDDAIAKLCVTTVTYSQIDRKSLRISAHVELYAIASSVKFSNSAYTYICTTVACWHTIILVVVEWGPGLTELLNSMPGKPTGL